MGEPSLIDANLERRKMAKLGVVVIPEQLGCGFFGRRGHHIHIYRYTDIHIYRYTYTHTHIHTYIHMYIHI